MVYVFVHTYKCLYVCMDNSKSFQIYTIVYYIIIYDYIYRVVVPNLLSS